MSPDLAARRLLMSAFLYYRAASPVIDDGEYDSLSDFVADHFDELHPTRKWQMGSAEDVRATGHHFKITAYTASAAIAWHVREKGHLPENVAMPAYRTDPETGLRWFPAEG